MSKQMTNQPGETKGQTTREDSALHLQANQVATRRADYHGRVRLGYVAGGIVAAIAIVGILLVTVVPTLAPSAPAQVQPAVTTTLPSMSNDLGFWNHMGNPVWNLPPMSNDLGFWDRIQSPATTLPPMSNSLGFWDRIQGPAPSLPPMSNSLGFWDFVH